MKEAGTILKKYWGHNNFRPLQEEIISAAVNKRDLIALLPTGGGKSICFQIPALVIEGICLVISPLVALMEDQVKALQQKEIKALAIPGGISYHELDILLDNCIYGNYKFLYLSPERLNQDIVQHRIKQMNISLIAIDEAHCISQWGHDFRPAYLNISVLRELKPDVPFMALTASATKAVVEDIQEQLVLRNSLIFKSSLERKNIAYKVVHAEDKIYRLRQILNDPLETAIIYVRTRKATMELSLELQQYGYTVAAFHGGLSAREKSSKLAAWLKDDVKIMVATNAFGMGIDKSNVRHVVHLNLPESIESYFQEAGRAGRDSELTSATIITNRSDLPLLKNQFVKTLPDLEFTILVYKRLNSYFRIAYGEGQEENFDFNFADFCSHYQLHTERAYNTLQLLDRLSIIQLSQQFRKATNLQFVISNPELFRYLDENPKYDNIVKSILRIYGGIFENKLTLNLSSISKKTGEQENTLIAALQKLHNDKIVDFDYQQNDASITFLVPREDEAAIYPFSTYIRNQAKSKIDKIEAILAYVANDKDCRSQQLLKYFGETSPSKCGICSVCKPPENITGKEKVKQIYKEIIEQLEEKEKNSRELVAAIPYPEAGILKVLQLLLEKEIIVLTSNNNYKLKHL
ncbi:RecQ family ATP-dependent DNA helicase [Antarcticibacterium sp. 1MA-6-2]|uniref:RecQ family ATP-dependent DNA helicase n=1 Tax=Antarcticibacterium sp. 1MA-6-2 TaxID=2908210 RepID=UPI001F26DC56|nr:RecQ family ATP-dependent DNA helicase [Antarcticibacterium sp. 1MA-6-2]UJH91843.1 RecQ family ATP-dependent DNA helicase [Antarcticibacterium sp. 1MA-6-2]